MSIESFQVVIDNWPLILPLFILQIGLMVAALVNIFKQSSYRIGNRLIWVVIVVIFQIIGPVCYFVFGRETV